MSLFHPLRVPYFSRPAVLLGWLLSIAAPVRLLGFFRQVGKICPVLGGPLLIV
jgi:hypothetical protein